MSDIKVGDLVVVVRGHSCTVAAFGGIPFRVSEIKPQQDVWWKCTRCKTKHVFPPSPFVDFRQGSIPLPWLKRIPPPEELGIVDEREEITA